MLERNQKSGLTQQQVPRAEEPEDVDFTPGVRTQMPSPSNLNKKDQVSKPHQVEQIEENKVSLMECESLTLSQIITDRKKEIVR